MFPAADVLAVKQALAAPAEVCARLGLLERRAPRGARYVLIRCPVHGDEHPSCSVFVGGDGLLGWSCKVCGEGGGVLQLVAQVHHLDDRRDFREVFRRAAELARVDLAAIPAPRAPMPLAVREPPPAEEVARLLRAGYPPAGDRLAADWLRRRALDPASCGALARVPTSCVFAWTHVGQAPRRRSWLAAGFRLLLPVYDSAGRLRSVRARQVLQGRRADGPKSLPPTDHGSAGLVLANRAAVEMLREGVIGEDLTNRHKPLRSLATGRSGVLIVEGEPDFLTWASRLPAGTWAVLGLPGSGAWTADLAARIPPGSEVVIRTDPDAAGDRYAERILEDLGGRCAVRVSAVESRRARAECACRGCVQHGWRWSTPCGRPISKGEDDNALLMRGALPADPREGTEAL